MFLAFFFAYVFFTGNNLFYFWPFKETVKKIFFSWLAEKYVQLKLTNTSSLVKVQMAPDFVKIYYNFEEILLPLTTRGNLKLSVLKQYFPSAHHSESSK